MDIKKLVKEKLQQRNKMTEKNKVFDFFKKEAKKVKLKDITKSLTIAGSRFKADVRTSASPLGVRRRIVKRKTTRRKKRRKK